MVTSSSQERGQGETPRSHGTALSNGAAHVNGAADGYEPRENGNGSTEHGNPDGSPWATFRLREDSPTSTNSNSGSRTGSRGGGRRRCSDMSDLTFAERIPEYLRPGYDALMRRDAYRAIRLWEDLYERFPSAEVCGHLARAHYYQIFFLGHDGDHPQHSEHVEQMRLWAERALSLNSHSSIGHAMLAGAIGRQAQLTGSRREVIRCAWQVRYHAECAIEIDRNWIGHYVMAMWHRELASLKPGMRTVVQLMNARKLPRGTWEESIAHFHKVLEQFPENNVILAEMAVTFYQMGDLVRAREYYCRCIDAPMFRHPVAPCFMEHIREQFDKLLLIDA